MNQSHLQNTRVTLYSPDLRKLIGSLSAAIVWGQLDYWFRAHTQGFYKFLCPPKKPHNLYRSGDSWTEELHFSAKEFRHAFDLIGVRHRSKSAFERAENPFIREGKELYFCCYHDKIKGTTHYFRNHQLTDETLAKLTISGASIAAEKTQKQQPPKVPLRKEPKVSSTYNTESTSENNNTAIDLSAFPAPKKAVAQKILAVLTVEQQHQVLQVLTVMMSKSIIKNKLGYLSCLVSSALTGSFTEIKPKPKSVPYPAKQRERKKPLPVDNIAYFAALKQKYGDNHVIETNNPSWQQIKRNLTGIR